MPNKPPVFTLGSYTNPLGSTISGASYGVELGGAGDVLNLGSINATAGTGVVVLGVGFVTNATTGVITGTANGVYTAGAGNIYNSGTITGEFGAGAYVKGVGSITNSTSAVIGGSSFGLKIAGAGTVDNLGSIYGTQGTGILTTGVGLVHNSAGGIISGSSFGLDFFESAGTVTNYGSVSSSDGTAAYIGGVGTVANFAEINGSMFGVDINAGGVVGNVGTISASQGIGVSIAGVGAVTNFASGSIDGSSFGVDILASGSVNNAGMISASDGSGVLVSGAGGIHNLSTGVIAGTSFGVDIGGAGTVSNAGNITASTGAGVVVDAAGDVRNLSGGTISGATYGVDMLGVAKVENAGVINGSAGTLGGAVVFQQASGDLVVDRGGIFNGNVTDLGGGGILELTASTLAGPALLNMGTSFSGFNIVNFDPASSWSLQGDAAELAGGQAINGFAMGDTLVLAGFTETTDTYVSGVGLELSNGTITETLSITGGFDTQSFDVFTLASGATEVIVCYLRGTRIMTPSGEVNVEALKMGDRLITRWHGVQPIKWIGRQSYGSIFVKGNRDQIPVRFAAGALGENLPLRDLYVSPGHSMLVNDVLILAKFLVNGVTITQDEVPEEVHYYQIEFENHDCVLAEGTWSESYADVEGIRGQFHNAAEFYHLFPDHKPPATPELCASRPEAGVELEAALLPVVARAGTIVRPGPLRGWIDTCDRSKIGGWVQDLNHPELPVLLEVIWPGRLRVTTLAFDYRDDLDRAGFGRGRCSFTCTFPIKLPASALNEIKVVRASDGVEIFSTAQCQAEMSKITSINTSKNAFKGLNRARVSAVAA